MANTYYDSELTAQEIENALEAINDLIVPANNGKVLAISNGKLEARSVQWGGGSAVVQPLSVTQNGTYNPPSGVDGYAPVTVDVSGGGDTFSVSAPTTTVGFSDGDFYYQRFGARLAYDKRNFSWKDSTSVYSTGNKFTVSEAVTVVGLWAVSRRNNMDVYLSKADGTQLVHINATTAVNGRNIFYLDAPITLEANTEYIVWYSNDGTGKYVDSGTYTPSDSRFTHIIAVYKSGNNQFPTSTISANLYPVDVLAIDSSIDEYVARQWKLKSGVWTPVNTITP